jgi:Uri superfamily endonuclease
MAPPGIYCLILANPACTVRVGRLGECRFPAGRHCYIGSALGPGGLARVRRHLRLAEARDRPPRWHIDYLLTDPRFTPEAVVWAVTPDRLECTIARAIGGAGIRKFGCSDCRCPTHLFSREGNPVAEVCRAFTAAGTAPHLFRPGDMAPDFLVRAKD